MVIRAGREFPSTWVAFHSCQNSPHPTPSSQGSVSLVQQDRSLPRGISSERDPGTLARVPAPSLVRSCAAASAGMGRWKLAGSCPRSHPNFSGWCLATPAKPRLPHPTAFCVGVAMWVTKGCSPHRGSPKDGCGSLEPTGALPSARAVTVGWLRLPTPSLSHPAWSRMNKHVSLFSAAASREGLKPP